MAHFLFSIMIMPYGATTNSIATLAPAMAAELHAMIKAGTD